MPASKISHAGGCRYRFEMHTIAQRSYWIPGSWHVRIVEVIPIRLMYQYLCMVVIDL
jgi:hypothetical protein